MLILLLYFYVNLQFLYLYQNIIVLNPHIHQIILLTSPIILIFFYLINCNPLISINILLFLQSISLLLHLMNQI